MNKKPPGRPTDSLKNNLLKIRIDDDTLQALDNIARESNRNRSEIIREIIPIISSKEFENMISLDTLQRLEQYSTQCSEYFQNPDLKIKLEDISKYFPAFVSNLSNSPILYIKFPTYKIRILLPHKLNAIKEVIEPLLKGIEGISNVYETHCGIIQNNSFIENTFLPELMCLKNNLSENTLIKDKICTIFNTNNINYEIWPAYYIVGKNVKMISKNKETYIVNIS